MSQWMKKVRRNYEQLVLEPQSRTILVATEKLLARGGWAKFV